MNWRHWVGSMLQGEGGKDLGKPSRQLTKTLIQRRPGALRPLLSLPSYSV